MAQVPILSGIYTDGSGEVRTAYPRNLMPVPKSSGVSEGYLRPADGLSVFAAGPGVDRGGINWNGVCYRVMGGVLVAVNDDGTITNLGGVGNGGTVTLDYSFDRLAIASGNSLYYYQSGTITKVGDPDLGSVVDMVWIDGYFATTDGTSIVVTDLNNPLSINPLKYGSAESDPDPIVRLLKPRNELTAVGRYTIEVFQNIGGDFFPFQRIDGARVAKGAVGTHMACMVTADVLEAIAFVGSGRNEPVSVYLAAQGAAKKIATREIETILSGYSESVLSGCLMETRLIGAQQLIYIHLPDQSLVYDVAASAALGVSVWFTLTSAVDGPGQYRAQGWVWCYGIWLFGDPQSSNVGTAVDTVSTCYGQVTGWEFSTQMLFAGPAGALIHDMELVSLPGRAVLGADPVVWTSYSVDGLQWSLEVPVHAGKQGETLKRLAWRRQGRFKNWRIQRFRGTSDSFLSVVRLEMALEALNV